MKKSLSLVLATLLFVVLGCSLGGLTGKKDEAPTPAPDSTSSDTTKSDTTSSDTKSDTKSTSGNSGNLTLDNFNKLKAGMKYDEVVKILGSEGSETSSSTIGNIELKSFKWEGDKFARIYVNFKNDEMTSKSQSGLGSSSSAGDADITKAKYDEIKNGMSYDEVKKIIGSEGEQNSSSSSGSSTYSSYTWKGANYSRISISLKDDKVTSKRQSNLK
ncbi:MAG: DUF3862 domain-containing protein [Acidobacteria bacterium]|nr:DUF3862 domain-containing protein [Acidobacteriota bacterium]